MQFLEGPITVDPYKKRTSEFCYIGMIYLRPLGFFSTECVFGLYKVFLPFKYGFAPSPLGFSIILEKIRRVEKNYIIY